MPFQELYPSDPLVPLTTFTIFKFPQKKIWWALRQIGRKTLETPAGSTFSRMLGSGRNGFDIVPDFRQYTFLAQWENNKAADDFFASSIFQDYTTQATGITRLKCSPPNRTDGGMASRRSRLLKI